MRCFMAFVCKGSHDAFSITGIFQLRGRMGDVCFMHSPQARQYRVVNVLCIIDIALLCGLCSFRLPSNRFTNLNTLLNMVSLIEIIYKLNSLHRRICVSKAHIDCHSLFCGYRIKFIHVSKHCMIHVNIIALFSVMME